MDTEVRLFSFHLTCHGIFLRLSENLVCMLYYSKINYLRFYFNLATVFFLERIRVLGFCEIMMGKFNLKSLHNRMFYSEHSQKVKL